jgi:hypothetical protein
VQKLGKPLPDIEAISARVTRTLGTGEFGVPRVADEHRPRLPPVVYVTQLWPQVLPVAQRFCGRSAQVPVLFGIALQRAIEHTAERLSPTVGASIAMECAVAMSKATLPAALNDLFQAQSSVPDTAFKARDGDGRTRAGKVIAARAASASLAVAPLPGMRATKGTGNGKRVASDLRALQASRFGMRSRPTTVFAMSALVASVAIGVIASASWERGRQKLAPTIARVETRLNVPVFRAGAAASTIEQPSKSSPLDEEPPRAEEAPPAQQTLQPAPSDDADLPAPPPDEGEGIIAEDWQSA